MNWEYIFFINLAGVLLGIQTVWPWLRSSGFIHLSFHLHQHSRAFWFVVGPASFVDGAFGERTIGGTAIVRVPRVGLLAAK